MRWFVASFVQNGCSRSLLPLIAHGVSLTFDGTDMPIRQNTIAN
jgi:hypothetical protein